MKKLLIIPGQLATFQSLKDRTLKIVFETQEPTPDQMGGLYFFLQKFGWLAFKVDEFREEDRELLSSLKTDLDTEKSKAQRLRAVLFRLWEQKPEGFETFTLFYDHHMEKIVTHFKNKME